MTKSSFKSVSGQQSDYIDDKTAALLLNTPTHARFMLWMMVLFLVVAVVWASWAQLDKVTVGAGKVIPSSQLQIVQNLEGGIVKEVLVAEGQVVKEGQQLLLIDDTQFQANYRETAQELAGIQADSIRLHTLIEAVQVNDELVQTNWRQSVSISEEPLAFTEEFEINNPRLVRRQRSEYRGKLSNLRNQLQLLGQQISQKEQELIEVNARVRNLRTSYDYAAKELAITRPLAEEGVVPRIELLKLERQVNDTKRELTSSRLQVPLLNAAIQEAVLKRVDTALQFRSELQSQLNETDDQLAAISESRVGLADRVKRTVVTSPVSGTIQKIHVNTRGGVIQPGMDLVEIVPNEDNLLVEAKIAPQDIAFLRPGLTAVVKFTAYDFTRYGGLNGELEHISADTEEDEEGNSFYLVRVRTQVNQLGTESEPLPIIPGMTTSVDIITGKRTVLDYLLNPVLHARSNALRE
ncbi:HlyD family type I secretion periplasmic adaptor subunit [Thaumasiovibrio subtropicus]|uniref:HlyD family type I secretion periplasmic adaptor subunit n=1 Tax=Thaumasiovibrio subtropicus TaxID=1891207 RepID=UPI000B3609B9|nr:HlyD family type I secretion periplasmic adaptor subunit [Thaumasiovibrio subtropicus]